MQTFIMIVLFVVAVIWLIAILYLTFKPFFAKTYYNQKIDWRCQDCGQNRTIYFSELQYREEAIWSVEESHARVSPYCHSRPKVKLIDMTSDEIVKQNARAARSN
jgi:hypothetical protein